jgi:hypothetical protein
MTDIQDAVIKTETKRKRRTKAEMETARLGSKLEAMGYDLEELEKDNPYNPTVEIVDLEPANTLTPLEYIAESVHRAGLSKAVEEVHPQFEPDGSCRRVELKAVAGSSFHIDGAGEFMWATFTGSLNDFPDFLKKITSTVTLNV